jgi:NYN domain
VFVIVSGDGAFASLAKKLHQQGKTAIGCAYENHTNRVFAAVCDYFIWLPEPEARKENTVNLIQTIAVIEESKINCDYRNVLNHFKITTPYSEQLRLDGVLLPNIKEIFTDLIPGFNQTNLGFNRFKDFLISLCQGTEFEIVSRNNNTEWLLKVRQINPLPRRRNLALT